MSTKEVNVSREAGDDPSATLKANVEAQFAAALLERASLELTQTGIGNLAINGKSTLGGRGRLLPLPGPYAPAGSL